MDEFQDPISFSIEFITLKDIISEACEGLLGILETNSGVGPGVKTGVKSGGPGVGVGDFGGENPSDGGHSNYYQNQSVTAFFNSPNPLVPVKTGIATVRDLLRVRYILLLVIIFYDFFIFCFSPCFSFDLVIRLI